jgi:histidine triad (HIT) family protein
VAFKDINPQAPVHILVIHKVHTPSVSETPSETSYIFADMFDAVREIANKFDLDKLGYRMIINNGKASGQLVFHVHIHILGGQENLGRYLPADSPEIMRPRHYTETFRDSSFFLLFAGKFLMSVTRIRFTIFSVDDSTVITIP